MSEPGSVEQSEQQIKHNVETEKPDSSADVAKPAETEKTSFTVKSYTPEEIDDEMLDRLDLYRIIRESTSITDEEKVKQLTKFSFQDNMLPKMSFIAEKDGKAIGYLLLAKLFEDTDPAGNKYTEVHITGTATESQWRGKGVQKKLWRQMIDEVNPSIISGESKNPAAVAARANILAQLGYRTYFGDTDITPGAEENTPVPPFVNEISENIIAPRGGKNGLFQAPSEYFVAETPDVESFSPLIQKAFEPLLAAQSQAGNEVAVVRPLISVKNGAPLSG